MLGGAPKAEIKKAKQQLKQIRDIVDEFIDLTQNTIYIVKEGEEKKIVAVQDLINEFYIVIDTWQQPSEYYKGKKFEKIDSHAAEVLYGVKRRSKK